jgi:hypothetical protein
MNNYLYNYDFLYMKNVQALGYFVHKIAWAQGAKPYYSNP